MCSFDPNDQYVNPASEENNEDSSAPEGCSSDLGANNGGNTCGVHKCSTHGPVDPQPNWGAGGFSLDRP